MRGNAKVANRLRPRPRPRSSEWASRRPHKRRRRLGRRARHLELHRRNNLRMVGVPIASRRGRKYSAGPGCGVADPCGFRSAPNLRVNMLISAYAYAQATHAIRHDRAAVRHIELIWSAACWSGYAMSPRGADRSSRRQPYEHRLAAAPYLAEPAAIRPRRSGRKIWSMTSAPVVITGRSSRR